MAATIKTMSTNLTFRQSDRLDQCFKGIKFQRRESEAFRNNARC